MVRFIVYKNMTVYDKIYYYCSYLCIFIKNINAIVAAYLKYYKMKSAIFTCSA